MRVMMVVIVALALIAMTQSINGADKVQNVGGDFGRMWLENNLAQNINESASNNTQNQTEADPLSEDWLGITSPLNAKNNSRNSSQNNTQGNAQGIAQQEIPYSMSGIIRPIHQMDASWNSSLLLPGQPEPDKYGLINGIPYELYYSIGPAYFEF